MIRVLVVLVILEIVIHFGLGVAGFYFCPSETNRFDGLDGPRFLKR